MLQITQWTLDYGRVTPATRSHYTGEEHPVFGWAVRSDRDGGRQSACHAVVYQGKRHSLGQRLVETAEQSIAYAGPALPEGVELGIALEIRDEAGEESAPYEYFFYNARVDWKAPGSAIPIRAGAAHLFPPGFHGDEGPEGRLPVRLRHRLSARVSGRRR